MNTNTPAEELLFLKAHVAYDGKWGNCGYRMLNEPVETHVYNKDNETYEANGANESDEANEINEANEAYDKNEETARIYSNGRRRGQKKSYEQIQNMYLLLIDNVTQTRISLISETKIHEF
ncbi:hypothetical protein BgiMline_008696 [Biomphalaria glabrata]